jgi:hypothetical protein
VIRTTRPPHPRRFRATRPVALALTALLLATLAALAPGSPVQASGPAVASVGDVSVVEGDTARTSTTTDWRQPVGLGYHGWGAAR